MDDVMRQLLAAEPTKRGERLAAWVAGWRRTEGWRRHAHELVAESAFSGMVMTSERIRRYAAPLAKARGRARFQRLAAADGAYWGAVNLLLTVATAEAPGEFMPACPFCGAKALLCSRVVAGRQMWEAQCSGCRVHMPPSPQKFQALDAWRRRQHG